MTDPSSTLSLPGLVPTAVQQTVPIVEQKQLARDTYRIRFHAPNIAERIHPGQFFMVRLPGENDPLLARPFALYDIYEEQGQPTGIDFVYLVLGKQTSLLPRLGTGDELDVWGPLGNGFPLPQSGHLMMIAGGIGQTPFLAVARETLGLRAYGHPPRRFFDKPPHVSMGYGVRSADFLAGLNDFSLDGLNVQIATDDGSQGHHGFVTALLKEALNSNNPPTYVYCCGPEAMMKATSEICERSNVPCWLSLESPMACGFGACFSCVVRVRTDDGDWDYLRCCVEGPVFEANRLLL